MTHHIKYIIADHVTTRIKKSELSDTQIRVFAAIKGIPFEEVRKVSKLCSKEYTSYDVQQACVEANVVDTSKLRGCIVYGRNTTEISIEQENLFFEAECKKVRCEINKFFQNANTLLDLSSHDSVYSRASKRKHLEARTQHENRLLESLSHKIQDKNYDTIFLPAEAKKTISGKTLIGSLGAIFVAIVTAVTGFILAQEPSEHETTGAVAVHEYDSVLDIVKECKSAPFKRVDSNVHRQNMPMWLYTGKKENAFGKGLQDCLRQSVSSLSKKFSKHAVNFSCMEVNSDYKGDNLYVGIIAASDDQNASLSERLIRLNLEESFSDNYVLPSDIGAVDLSFYEDKPISYIETYLVREDGKTVKERRVNFSEGSSEADCIRFAYSEANKHVGRLKGALSYDCNKKVSGDILGYRLSGAVYLAKTAPKSSGSYVSNSSVMRDFAMKGPQ